MHKKELMKMKYAQLWMQHQALESDFTEEEIAELKRQHEEDMIKKKPEQEEKSRSENGTADPGAINSCFTT